MRIVSWTIRTTSPLTPVATSQRSFAFVRLSSWRCFIFDAIRAANFACVIVELRLSLRSLFVVPSAAALPPSSDCVTDRRRCAAVTSPSVATSSAPSWETRRSC